MLNKQELSELFVNEYSKTVNLFAALPHGQMEYSPHSKSRTANQLILTMTAEIFAMEGITSGTETTAEEWQAIYARTPKAENSEQAAKFFEESYKHFLSVFESVTDEDLKKDFNFYGTPGTRSSALLGMLCDFIHHRGQFSVYVRATDGKVPSIYGPTADDEI